MSEFAESFKTVIGIADPFSNSVITSRNKRWKVLADWGRKACKEIEQLEAEIETEAIEHLHIQQNTEVAFVSRIEQLETKNKKLERKIIRVRKLRKQYADSNMNFLSGKYVAEAITQILNEK